MNSKVANPARHQRRADGIVDLLVVHVLGSAPFVSIGHSVSTSDLVPRKPPTNVPGASSSSSSLYSSSSSQHTAALVALRTKRTRVIVIDPGFQDVRLAILADECDVLLSTYLLDRAEPAPLAPYACLPPHTDSHHHFNTNEYTNQHQHGGPTTTNN
ncbi:uncharacterized protein F4817DRAFT_318471 [Daldinia loculata]|uniref:uncharacterized protein n=1 Tax=Daldinia loculata TaxID=103429 RepID=UPI0020C470A3|nr:uncharacterized protein F4817DRAFT_318471 [Daldinia loculata]KAI1644807.1 hypothetical protein F4817DRAFT_318471 [Daldinia loculata]